MVGKLPHGLIVASAAFDGLGLWPRLLIAGVCEAIDVVGLEVILSIANYLFPEIDRCAEPVLYMHISVYGRLWHIMDQEMIRRSSL